MGLWGIFLLRRGDARYGETRRGRVGEESARNGDEASERYLKRRNMGQLPFADHDRKSCACALVCDVAG